VSQMTATQLQKREKAMSHVAVEKEKISITFEDVKKYLCPKASDAEVGLFLKVCQAERLNPFAHEVFLVKYADDQPAAIIIATETFLKSAEACPQYDGVEAGIILKDTAGKLDFREGSFLLDEESKNLVGGWAKVYRKDRKRPIYAAVNIKECIKYTRSGRPTRFWDDMPATMVRKVALSRALREAFPNRFAGTLTTAEYEEIPEGKLPPALEKGGKPDWKKFWARVKSELGLTTDQARQLLRVDSIKEELIDRGWTMEQIWDSLVAALQQQVSEAKPDEDWNAFWSRAQQLGLSKDRVHELLGMTIEQWIDHGKTLEEAIDLISERLAEPHIVETEEAAEGGFAIDLEWLKDAQQRLKWSDETMKTFILSQYKVSGKSVTDALNNLTREQAEDFVSQINKRLEKQQSLF
jgi:phage recombination protein Bet